MILYFRVPPCEEFVQGETIEVVVDVEHRKESLEELNKAEIFENDDICLEPPLNSNERFDIETYGILSGFKSSKELANICHIDSSEASDDSPEGSNELEKKELRLFRTLSKTNRQSLKSKSGSYENNDATNLISTSPDDDDDYDDFTRELGLDSVKKCSIAHFIEGNDIARRSIKCRHRKLASLDDLDLTEAVKDIRIPTIQISSSDNEYTHSERSRGESTSSGYLDVVELRIQGSNNNIRGSTDGMYLTEYQQDTHRKSLALSETDDEELVRYTRYSVFFILSLCNITSYFFFPFSLSTLLYYLK